MGSCGGITNVGMDYLQPFPMVKSQLEIDTSRFTHPAAFLNFRNEGEEVFYGTKFCTCEEEKMRKNKETSNFRIRKNSLDSSSNQE